MPYIPLINTETGEVDHLRIAERAPLRAAAEFGSPNFPPSYLREATEWLKERAAAERRQWQRHHGQPVDHGGPCTLLTPFGHQHEGVRRSAF